MMRQFVLSVVVILVLPSTMIVDSHDDDDQDEIPEDSSLRDVIIMYLKQKAGSQAMDSIDKLNTLFDRIELHLDDLSEEQRQTVIKKYIEDNIVDKRVMEYRMFFNRLKLYLEEKMNIKEKLAATRRQQMYTIAQSIMDGDTDAYEIEENILEFLKGVIMMAEQTPQIPMTTFIYSVMSFLLADPDNEMLQMMLIKAVNESNDPVAAVYATTVYNVNHHRANANDALKQTSRTLLSKLVSDDGAKVGIREPRVTMQMMAYHYLSNFKASSKMDSAAMTMIQLLIAEGDPDSLNTAAQLATYMITDYGAPADMSEDEQWKWFPPGFCQIDSSSGQPLQTRQCPEDIQCAIGPADVNMNGTNYRVTLCALPIEYMSFHACEKKLSNGTIVLNQPCSEGDCSVGPYSMQWNGINFNVMYCSSLTTLYYQNQTMYNRSCAVTNARNFASVQRQCPLDFSCTLGPFELPSSTGSDDKYAMMCKAMEQNTYEKMIDLHLGPIPENASNTEEKFTEFLINFINDNYKKYSNPDPDKVGLLILTYFKDKIEEIEGRPKLMGDILDILQVKVNTKTMDPSDTFMLKRMVLYFSDFSESMSGSSETTGSDSTESRDSSEYGYREDSSDSTDSNEMNDLSLQLLKMILSRGSPPPPHSPPPQAPARPDAGSLLMQLMSMYIQSQGGQRPTPPPPQGMANMAALLLQHALEHAELSDQQDKHGQMLQTIQQYIENQMATDDQKDMINQIRNMLKSES